MHVLEASPAGTPPVLIELDDATVVLVGPSPSALEGDMEGRAEDAINKLKEIGASIGETCDSIYAAVRDRLADAKPQEFALEFGVKISGEGSAIISKVSGEASIKVTATWRSDGSDG